MNRYVMFSEYSTTDMETPSKTRDVIFIIGYHNRKKLLYHINVKMKSEALKTITLIFTHRYMLLSIMLYS